MEKKESFESWKESDYEENQIRRHLNIYKLNQDCFNEWVRLSALDQEWRKIEPLMSYEERIKSKYGDLSKLVLELSEPNAVIAYNELVNRVNNALPEMNETKDYKKAENFLVEVANLLEEKKVGE